eukprot:TRINITY_DN11421_c0_g1_i4.p3 TRINITY_DN11421_c0_g1~~TRINITY_DN11421_c0_g1_i4.p3  ORF type:complete len:100 (-),score=2.13 TRINITY_DN11421_c0_g1_i4:12-311(-)
MGCRFQKSAAPIISTNTIYFIRVQDLQIFLKCMSSGTLYVLFTYSVRGTQYTLSLKNAQQLHVLARLTTKQKHNDDYTCLLYTSPSPRDGLLSRMPSSA